MVLGGATVSPRRLQLPSRLFLVTVQHVGTEWGLFGLLSLDSVGILLPSVKGQCVQHISQFNHLPLRVLLC